MMKQRKRYRANTHTQTQAASQNRKEGTERKERRGRQ